MLLQPHPEGTRLISVISLWNLIVICETRKSQPYSFKKLTLPDYICGTGSTAEQTKFCSTRTKAPFALRKVTWPEKAFVLFLLFKDAVLVLPYIHRREGAALGTSLTLNISFVISEEAGAVMFRILRERFVRGDWILRRIIFCCIIHLYAILIQLKATWWILTCFLIQLF